MATASGQCLALLDPLDVELGREETERPQRSGCGRWPAALELTVSATLLTFKCVLAVAVTGGWLATITLAGVLPARRPFDITKQATALVDRIQTLLHQGLLRALSGLLTLVSKNE